MDMVFVQQNMDMALTGKREHVKDQQFLVQYISRNEILNHKYSTLQDTEDSKIKMQPNAKAYLI